MREEAGRLVVTKDSAEDAVSRVYGILKEHRRTDRLMDSLRGKSHAV